ncbi:MAG TPA: hypothetical protein PLO56_02495 [Rhodothermales bacterium]|nr:hypothetical protein [Rhodothermales bacterium]
MQVRLVLGRGNEQYADEVFLFFDTPPSKVTSAINALEWELALLLGHLQQLHLVDVVPSKTPRIQRTGAWGFVYKKYVDLVNGVRLSGVQHVFLNLKA